MGLGCMTGLSTLPSVNAPRLLGSTTVSIKREKKMGEVEKLLGIGSKIN